MDGNGPDLTPEEAQYVREKVRVCEEMLSDCKRMLHEMWLERVGEYGPAMLRHRRYAEAFLEDEDLILRLGAMQAFLFRWPVDDRIVGWATGLIHSDAEKVAKRLAVALLKRGFEQGTAERRLDLLAGVVDDASLPATVRCDGYDALRWLLRDPDPDPFSAAPLPESVASLEQIDWELVRRFAPVDLPEARSP